ncbi:MAG: anti-sigma factor [Acidimicrobiales bacterium]
MTRRWRRRRLMCPEVRRTLQRYLDGEVDDDWAARVRAHLEDCRRCGLEADTYQALKANLEARGPEVPDELVTRLRQFAEGLVAGGATTDDPPR